MIAPCRRVLGSVAVTAALFASPGCIVVALHPFYPDSAIVLDDRLPGRWQSVEDNVSVTIERGEWRSYRVAYEHPTDKRTLTGYLFKAGDHHYVDLSPLRGEDPGAFLLPGHALVRLSFGEDELRAAPLDFDAMMKAVAARSAPVDLLPVVAERGQITFTAERPVLERWIGALKTDAAVWADATVLKRVKTIARRP